MGQKEANKKESAGKNAASGSGGDGGAATVILKADLHCEGCAQKVKRTIEHMPGVEKHGVKVDFATQKITVMGNVDPVKVKERVEGKTKKNVELLFPRPPPAKKDKDVGGSGGGGGKSGGKTSDELHDVVDNKKMAEQKKPKDKEVVGTTVVLKTQVHCDNCAGKINKIINKYEGVTEVNVDLAKDQVMVKGTMNMTEMIPYLNTKLKREVKIVLPPKKDQGGGNKKPKDNNPSGEGSSGGGHKKGKEVANPTGGGEKNRNGDDPKWTAKVVEENTSKIEIVNRMEYNGYPYENGAYTYNPQQVQGDGYVAEYWNGPDYMYASDNMNAPPYYLHAPQMFSDENPNACSIM